MRKPKPVTIGERIRARRVELGMTQLQLADRVGLKQTAVSYIETGKRDPAWRHLEPILSELGMSISVE